MGELLHPPDPDDLPFQNAVEKRDELLKKRLSRPPSALVLSRILTNFLQQHHFEVGEIKKNFLEPLPSPETKARAYSAIVDVPIHLETEQPAQLQETFVSIGQAADQLSDETLIVPWLNFTADVRREQEKIKEMRLQAEIAQRAIIESLEGHNTQLITGFDHLPAKTPISRVRHRNYLGSLLAAQCRLQLGNENLCHPHLYLTPQMSVDADTTIGETALVDIRRVINNNEALFINGTLIYTGGVMEKEEGEVACMDTGSKLLYLTEHMRRLMINDLEPTKRRGYRPESGLAYMTGTVAALGGYNTHADNNESYWLEYEAYKQMEEYVEYQTYLNPYRPPLTAANRPEQEPVGIPEEIRASVKRVGRYEAFPVYTSIRGLESAIKKHGVKALIGFDHGLTYTLWSDDKSNVLQAKDAPLSLEKLDFSATTRLLNCIYSHFVDCGGELSFEKLFTFNELVSTVISPPENALTPGQPVWMPHYIDKGQRAPE